MISRNKGIMLFLALVLVFFALRLPALHHSYHQDEYKWSFIVDPSSAYYEPGRIPHPPIGEFVYEYGGRLVGFQNLRAIPLIFSLANLFLVFWLAKIIFGRRAGFGAAGLFSISFFSVLSSLMVDTDGAIMPFFFLLMAIGYFKLKATSYKLQATSSLLILVGAVGGFLVKVSFGAAIAALVLDFFIERRVFSDKKKFLKFLGWAVGLSVVFVFLLWASRYVFTSFRLESSFEYWQHFVNWGSRSWLQVFIQTVKTVLFASPLLLLPLLWGDREIFRKARSLLIFVFLNLFAYIIVFDFSAGALDRYLQFLVAPLCIVVGAIFSKAYPLAPSQREGELKAPSLWGGVWSGAVVSVVIFSFQFLTHSVSPLYPKTEWISRILSLKWNFLYPFLGGSGPTPFYVSFLFIGLLWLVCFGLAAVAIFRPRFRGSALLAVLILGISYNLGFAEEYGLGKINGNSSRLIKDATAFIAASPDIQKVTAYNDNGGGEIVRIDKYRKRLYVDPKFDVNEKIKSLNQYKEHYLVVDIPHLDPTSVYQKYFNMCRIIYQKKDKKIDAFVYDCRGIPDIKND